MSQTKKPTAIVVATAARLAHAGFDVTVYEKNDFCGGRCSLIHHDGYRFDQGPSLLLLPPLFHELYNDLGTKLEDHLDLIQCNPNYIIHYHDGEKVTLSTDRARMGAEAEKWDGPGGASRLEGFLREAEYHAYLSYTLVLNHTFPHFWNYLRPAFLKDLVKLHPFGSLYGRCARYFKTERMRRAFSFGSMHIHWTETCEGIWYPKGGFNAVVQSFIKIAEGFGASFHYSAPVSRVLHDGERATGVRFEDGREVSADLVIVNADLAWSYNNLFLDHQAAADVQAETQKLLDPKKAKNLLDKPHSCSSISFYWAMSEIIPTLNAHNIFLAEDYKDSFDDIFKRKGMPREPSFYSIARHGFKADASDPTAAPEGKDALVVLVPVGHMLPPGASSTANDETQDWDALVDRARAQVLEILEARLGIQDLKSKITWESVNTPVTSDMTGKEKFNLTHGSILGITHDFFNVLAFRHQARHPRLKDAYFVGASTHPGTGVPIAIAGSKLVAKTIFEDRGVSEPATYSAAKLPATSSELDRPQPRKLWYSIEDFADTTWPLWLGVALTALAVMAAAALFPALLPAVLRAHRAEVVVKYIEKPGLGNMTSSAAAAATGTVAGLTGGTFGLAALALAVVALASSGSKGKATAGAKAGADKFEVSDAAKMPNVDR